jgi:hypothetical protein
MFVFIEITICIGLVAYHPLFSVLPAAQAEVYPAKDSVSTQGKEGGWAFLCLFKESLFGTLV